MRIDFLELMPAGDYVKVKEWAEVRGLPVPWLMQIHPDNYPVKSVEWRIVFEMPDGRKEFIRSEDWIAVTHGKQVHGIDWLDVEKNYHLVAPPAPSQDTGET